MKPTMCQLIFCLSEVLLIWLSCLSCFPVTSFSPFCAASTASSQPSVGSVLLSFLQKIRGSIQVLVFGDAYTGGTGGGARNAKAL